MGRYGDSRNNILVKRTAPSSYDFSCGYVVRDQHWHSLSDTFDEYVNFWRSFDDEYVNHHAKRGVPLQAERQSKDRHSLAAPTTPLSLYLIEEVQISKCRWNPCRSLS